MILLIIDVKIIIGDYMNIVDHKCPTCDSVLNFDVNTQCWVCNYCKNKYTLEELQSNINKYNNTKINNLDIYECTSCGAKVICDSSTISTNCIYCGNSLIIKKRLVDNYKPDYIITFKNNKEQIKSILSKNLKSKIFSDSNFGNIDNITQVTQLYVPYWLLSCEVMASIKGIYYAESKDYVKNKLCSRLGVMKFNRIPADAKKNLSDELLQGIEPLKFDELVPFEYPYLAGMYAECFDQNEDEIIKNNIKKRIEEAAEEKLSSTIHGSKKNFSVHERNTFIKKDKFEYVLVPVWFIKLKYKNKDYVFAVNDQTYKVSGIRHINSIKVMLSYLLLTLLSALPILYVLNDNISNSDFKSTILTILILIIIGLFTALSSIVSSYKKIKKGKKSSDYVNEGSFQLLQSSDQDSF